MSYTYKGKVFSITGPLVSVSVNKLNVVIKDQVRSQLFEFTNRIESKDFLALLYKA
jgi:hypothetical protein